MEPTPDCLPPFAMMTEIHRCCSRCIRRVPKARGAPPPMMSAQRHRCRRSTSLCVKNFRTDVAAASTSKPPTAGTRARGLAPSTVRGNFHRRQTRILASWQLGQDMEGKRTSLCSAISRICTGRIIAPWLSYFPSPDQTMHLRQLFLASSFLSQPPIHIYCSHSSLPCHLSSNVAAIHGRYPQSSSRPPSPSRLD